MSVIYALATPPAKSAICVFRVSGESCLDLFKEFFSSPPKKERFFYLKNFYFNGGLVDRVGVVYFKGPKSYTGCLLYTSPSPRDGLLSRMPSSA